MDRLAQLILLLQLTVSAFSASTTLYVDVNGAKCDTQTGTSDCPFFNVDTALHQVVTNAHVNVAAGTYWFNFDQDYFKVIDSTIDCDNGPVVFRNSSLLSNALQVKFTGHVTFSETVVALKKFEYKPTNDEDKLVLEGSEGNRTHVRADVIKASNLDVGTYSILKAVDSLTVAHANVSAESTVAGSTITCDHCHFAAKSSLYASNSLHLNHSVFVNGSYLPFTRLNGVPVTIDNSDIASVFLRISTTVSDVTITNSTLRTSALEVGPMLASASSSRLTIQDSVITHNGGKVETIKFHARKVLLTNVELRSLHLHNYTNPLMDVTTTDGYYLYDSQLLVDSVNITNCNAASVLSVEAQTVVIANTILSARDYSGATHTSPVKFNNGNDDSTARDVVFQNSVITCADSSSSAVELGGWNFNLALNDLQVNDCSNPKCSNSSVTWYNVTNCVTCPLGMMAVNGSCSNCPAGTFGEERGVCSPCAAGTYTSNEGQTYCSSCSYLEYQPLTGQSDCLRCGKGSEYVDSTTCSLCGENTYQFSDGGLCFDCITWFETSEAGDGECSTNVGRIMILLGSILGGAVVFTAVAYVISRKQNAARRLRQTNNGANNSNSNSNNNSGNNYNPYHQMNNGWAPANGPQVIYVVAQPPPNYVPPPNSMPQEATSSQQGPQTCAGGDGDGAANVAQGTQPLVSKENA